MRQPCRYLLILAFLPAMSFASSEYQYDARMAFLKAGELLLELNRHGHQYSVAGEFQTSRAMSAYYTWNGVFAAVGHWNNKGPVTTAYMAQTSGKDEDLKIALTTEKGARLLEGEDGDFEDIDKPEGIDLISAIFFHPGCYRGGQVHDGEDSYQLKLRRENAHGFNGGRNYFRGQVTSCDYDVIDYKDRKRRVIVYLADVDGNQVAVQVRVKIPILPDAIFRLKVPGHQPQLAQSH